MAALRSSPSYLAVLTDPELAERAHYYPSVELCEELLHRWEEAKEGARHNDKEEIEDLQASLSDAETEIGELEDEVEELKQKITSFVKEVREAKTQARELEVQLANTVSNQKEQN